MWAAVRQLTGRRRKDKVCDEITAETLNQHYARISTDIAYQRAPRKLTATHRDEDFVSEWQLFSILDTLPPTATGLDHLPAWFIRLGDPVFSKPLAHLFNKFLSSSTIPLQWKYALYSPSQKLLPPSCIVTFGQYMLLLSSVGHLNVSSSDNFYILLFSPPSLSFFYRPICISSHRVHRCWLRS